MAKEKKPLYVTPVGIAQYPHLTKPDTKFNPDGEYKVTLEVPSDEAAEMIKLIEKAHEEALAAGKEEAKGKRVKEGDYPFAVNDEAGTVSFRFKLKARVVPKKGDPFEQKPAVVDAKRKPLGKDIVVGGGSKIKVAYEVITYYTAIAGAGVSLRLKAVQVLDLKQFGGGAGAANVFGEEDGFTSDEEESDTPFAGNDGDSEDF
jgi:hypothetical protein